MREKLQAGHNPLSTELRQAVDLLIKQTDPINSIKSKNTKQASQRQKRDHRLPIPGTTLHKKYKGQIYTVLVLKDAFEFKQKRYKSLSAIAKKITGSHWNGFNFFGLEK